MDPEVILFDEPTSALIPWTRRRSIGCYPRKIAKRAQGYDDYVNSRVALPRSGFNQVVFMEGGVIVEQGDPKVVLEHPTEERTRKFLSRLPYTR